MSLPVQPEPDHQQGSSGNIENATQKWQQANKQLHESYNRIEAIIQSIADCVVVADRHGNLQLFNRAAEELLGIGLTDRPPAEWPATYGLFLPDGVTPCPAEEVPLAQAVRGTTVHNKELVVKNPARGDMVFISVRARPIRNHAGELAGGVAVFHDISARKQAEADIRQANDKLELRVAERTAQLRESEARYLDLYQNAPDMFLSVEVTTTHITDCNQTLLTVTQLDRKQIIGKSLFDIFDSSCLQAVHRAIGRIAKSGKVQDINLLLLCADDCTIDVSLNASVVRDTAGQITHARLVLRDVSDARRAEEQIHRQQQELAHVTRMSTMGEMAAGLAHELNQPLASIATYAEAARMRIEREGADVPHLKEVFNCIAADAFRAGEVIRRMRHFVKKSGSDRTSINLNNAVREVFRFVSNEAALNNTTMRFRPDENLENVVADMVELQQVLLNLIRNSFDAVKDASVVERIVIVETHRLPPASVEVIVTDTGPGITAELWESVFDQFVTSKSDGLGMGLTISRSIIESHGGRIWLGTPTVGTQIHFTLPTVADTKRQG